MEGPRPIQGLSGLGRAGQPILAGVPFGEGFQPAQSRRKAAAGRIARQDCLPHRLLCHKAAPTCVIASDGLTLRAAKGFGILLGLPLHVRACQVV